MKRGSAPFNLAVLLVLFAVLGTTISSSTARLWVSQPPTSVVSRTLSWSQSNHPHIQSGGCVTSSSVWQNNTITLYNQPAICRSKQPGQASEHIVYRDAAPGTYYIRVYLEQRSPVAPDTYLLRVAFEDKPAACTAP